MPWTGVAAAGASLLGGLFGASSAKSAAKRQMKFNAEQAQLDRDFQAGQAGKQMEFQERMSSTAYQRAMADMRAGGLNPILAYQQGGSSSPGGAAGSGSKASGALGETPSHAAMQVASAIEAIRNLKAQNANIHEQNENLKASRGLIDAQEYKTRWEGEYWKDRSKRWAPTGEGADFWRDVLRNTGETTAKTVLRTEKMLREGAARGQDLLDSALERGHSAFDAYKRWIRGEKRGGDPDDDVPQIQIDVPREPRRKRR